MSEWLNTNPCVASVSGGKDSTALALHLREREREAVLVFADTGWEFAETYEYLDYLRGFFHIHTVRAEIPLSGVREEMAQELEAVMGRYSPMVRAVLKKTMFPARTVRWCTSELKVKPIMEFVEPYRDLGEVYNAVGVRGEESHARASLPELEWDESRDLWVWRPIHSWTVAEVVEIHQRHNIRPNPLYLRGLSRVGCGPCIFARKSEIRSMGLIDSKRAGVIERLEGFVAELYRTEKPDNKYQPPTWFQSRVRTPGMVETGYAWPISEAIKWADTSDQTELFTVADSGCLRWGLCEK